MTPFQQELHTRYAGLSDSALLQLGAVRDTLTEEAAAMLEKEFEARGFPLPDPAIEPAFQLHDTPLWVTVERFRDLSSALVARGALEAAGIECFLRDENTVRMDWQISNFIGGMRLQVKQPDEEAARAVLEAAALQNGIELDPAMLEPEEHCPHCGSGNIHRVDDTIGIRMAAVWLFGLPLPRGKRFWRCSDCGNRCEERELQLKSAP